MQMEDYGGSDDDYYDYEDGDFGCLEEVEENSKSPKGSSTKIISKATLLAAQREDLRRVMELLSLKEHHARTLLIHYRWDVDRLTAVYVEKGKPFLFSEAGVTVVERLDTDSVLASSSTITCKICYEDVSGDAVTRMECGHFFCNDCWTEYFVVKINEGLSRRIRCMAHKCKTICDEVAVRNLVSKRHPDLAEKFERFLLESYIEDNELVKWCPSIPHCGNAIQVEEAGCCEVECSCGIQFCFSCLCEAHSPCSCLMWKLWSKKCKDESETVNWMTVHTKSCPKCYKPVEKNGGCNLVTCICGQSFCWLCGGATGRDHTWSSIAGHSCGRYKEDQSQQAERAKRDLYRYMHYHNRYKAHTDSFKLESKLKDTILEKVSICQERALGLKDFAWITDGLCRLFRSRRVLSCTYPFAFYMFGEELFKDDMTPEEREIKQNLFEDQQQQLESNVEKLSKYLEEPFDQHDDDKILEIRQQVISLSKIIDDLCKEMYKCIEDELVSGLLNSLHVATHSIAPYRSKGIEKASVLSSCWSSKVGPADNDSYEDDASGETRKRDRSSGSDSGCSPRKRARNETGGFFDLNFPAEIIDRN